MAALTSQAIAITGLAPTYTAASTGGDTCVAGDRTFLHVRNGGGSNRTVTIDSQQTCDQGVDHDSVVIVPAGADRFIGPLSSRRFQNSLGVVDISYDAVASLSVACLRIP